MTETAVAPAFQIDETTQDALFRSARSVRAWSDEPVAESTVEAVYDLVRWGPTALNASPLRLLQVRSPEARERLHRGPADPGGTTGHEHPFPSDVPAHPPSTAQMAPIWRSRHYRIHRLRCRPQSRFAAGCDSLRR